MACKLRLALAPMPGSASVIGVDQTSLYAWWTNGRVFEKAKDAEVQSIWGLGVLSLLKGGK
ncbi:MAG: hypothetical protein PF630_05625 [Gammaproteobacteria bacterium]|jgi:hypothetical protein|nr:hypothetical protein [Gammaproteobacteria bacterium]